MSQANLNRNGAPSGQNAGAADASLVLVVGNSKVNRIVVSGIVERTGARAVAEAPEAADRVLEMLRPGTVILDGGADNRDCDEILERIGGIRRAAGSDLPKVVLLTSATGTPETLAPGKLVDAVVVKPITPERLQPLLAQLIEDARG
jgi:CheY-like chemotaxis protein